MPHVTIRRIRGEYLEMPGLRLTLEQAQRLCGVDRTLCQQVLDQLVGEGFLDVRPDGTYARPTDDTSRARVVKAELTDKRVKTAS
jgi:DNA-binding GntR family transcriptional regulator